MENLPPSSQATDRKSSLHHKAANGAVLVVIFTIVYSTVVGMSGNETANNAGWYGLAAGLLFIAALPAGIVALLGIKKYGKQRLLWKGLVGILVPVIIFSAAIPVAIEKYKQEDMEKAVAAISKKSPRQIDKTTRLDGASITARNEITIRYSVTDLAVRQFDKAKLDADYAPKIRRLYTLSSAFSQLLKRGIKIKILYAANAGAPIYEILITEKDLGP